MRKSLPAALAASLLVALTGCTKTAPEPPAVEAEAVPAPAEPVAEVEVVDVNNEVCPVTGEKAQPDVTVDYEGKRYHFCCAGCDKTFLADPAKYIAKLEAGEVGGEADHKMDHDHADHSG